MAKTNSDGTNRNLAKLYLLYDLKNLNEPKNEDDIKTLTTLKVTQNPKYCNPFFTFVTLILQNVLIFDIVTYFVVTIDTKKMPNFFKNSAKLLFCLQFLDFVTF